MGDSLWRRVLFPNHTSERDAPRVLVITKSPEDESFYQKLKQTGEWNIVVARSVQEAAPLITAHEFPIILYDREVPDSDWREVLARIGESSPRSCFLLASPVSDEYLWREVVMHGGYDVVAKPLEEDDVIHTLHRAWYYWKSDPTVQDR